MVSLELEDIQGNILQGYSFPRAAYRFLEVPDKGSGRAFLGETVGEVTSAEPWDAKPKTTTNVALTYSGLGALGVAAGVLGALPEAFYEPMRERALKILGDTGPRAPEHWVDGLGTERSHILVMIYGSEEDDRGLEFQTAVTELHDRAATHGLTVVHSQNAAALDNRREHFGWADGFGQPSIEGVGGSRAGQGVPQGDGITWADVKAGEFVLGYADEEDEIVSGPAATLLRNGTYMVYRKLYQDVVRFRRELYKEAARYAENVKLEPPLDGDQLYELMAAKVVGRWRDGVAIELAPRRTASALGGESQDDPDNDFRYYAEDPDGLVCPRGAHIRRTNPRDALGWNGTMTRRHRIIRRGMPYGPFLAGLEDDDQDRGLIFICLNADLARQFEVVQSQWCNDGNAFALGTDKDYLLGDDTVSGKVTIQGDPPHLAHAQPEIVLTRGSEYLLMPGIKALQKLASG